MSFLFFCSISLTFEANPRARLHHDARTVGHAGVFTTSSAGCAVKTNRNGMLVFARSPHHRSQERQQEQRHFIRTQRGDDPVGGETLTSLSECSIMASSLDSDGPSSMTLQVVSKHCTCVVPLLRAANYARSLVKEENS